LECSWAHAWQMSTEVCGQHGAENDKTFFLHHNAVKGHHIDLVLATPYFTNERFSVSVGRHSDWANLSDHMPVTCSIDVESGGRRACHLAGESATHSG